MLYTLLHRCHSRALTVLWLGLGALAACDQPSLNPITPSARTPDTRPFVTGEAARDLGTGGQFTSAGVGPAASREENISSARARELAVAYIRTWGRYQISIWNQERGTPVDLSSLTPDSRVFYAETPYGAVPGDFHPAFRRAFGPWYLVTFAQGGQPALVVAVSAYNTDVKIDGHGFLVVPRLSGNDFKAVAVAATPSVSGVQPITPERAVELVGRRSGARTQRTPTLMLLNVEQHPAGAAWGLELDRPIRVMAAGNAREVRSLFVSQGGRYFVAKPRQPMSHRGTGILYNAAGQRLGPAALEVPVRAGGAVEFDEVTLEAPEA